MWTPSLKQVVEFFDRQNGWQIGRIVGMERAENGFCWKVRSLSNREICRVADIEKIRVVRKCVNNTDQ
jgi:hypothetical protein